VTTGKQSRLTSDVATWFPGTGGSGTLERCIKVVDTACYRRKHGRLDTRISHHAALVNGESSYGLTLVEMFISGSGWAEDWPQYHFSIVGQGKEGWGTDIGDYDSQPREEEGEGQGRVGPLYALPYLFLVYWRLVLMEWQI
jgi:hypothetical protein